MTWPDVPAPTLRLKRDAAALAANWRALDTLSGAARAGAAVKADAYGLGAAFAVQTLRAAGCENFFVAHWSEVATVVAHSDPTKIAVLHGPVSPADAAYARALGVRPVINSLHQARLWRDSGGGLCDVMVNTGINRIGLDLADLADPIVQGLTVDVLHSHLLAAEEPDNASNARQLSRWEEARRSLPHRRAALANSAGIVLGKDYHGDLTRPGIALYGGVPCDALAPHIAQVATPEAALIQVRDVAAGEGLGYNATFVAPRAMRIGVLSLGYADGYLRAWSGIGQFQHGDALLPVLGRVSMDMTLLDLSAAPMLREGDWLAANYALPDAAAASGLSQYELLTVLGRRFER